MATLIPIKEYEWDANFDGDLKAVTCVNHPTARYLTKHIWDRGLHFVEAADGFKPFEECTCPLVDLAVVVER
jgi:hypothetical protein